VPVNYICRDCTVLLETGNTVGSYLYIFTTSKFLSFHIGGSGMHLYSWGGGGGDGGCVT
jgi:hypothetical protein